MSPERVRLLLRRQELQLRAAHQRRASLALLDEIDAVADRIDSVRAAAARAADALGRHPWALALAGAILLVWRPRGMLRWAQRGLLTWQAASRLRRSLLPLLARLAGLRI